jgi:hypothetical protein
MTETLEKHASRLRSAVSSGDFTAGQEALEAYAQDLQRTANSARDPAALARLESDWCELVLWTRSMAATARELAWSAWIQIPTAAPYRAVPNHRLPMLDTRG